MIYLSTFLIIVSVVLTGLIIDRYLIKKNVIKRKKVSLPNNQGKTQKQPRRHNFNYNQDN